MREVVEFPRPVREVENIFIPLADGRRLASRMWLPEDAESDPVPVVIEYMPYRKRDHFRPRDSEQLWWTDTMVLFNSRPPDPAIVGEAWRTMWQERLDDNAPWIDTWLDHQHRDDFWRHASICENWRAIRCPVFAVGG